MAWVNSEYAEEFAVVAAWVSAAAPWSVSVALGEIEGGSLLQVHFPFLLVRYLFGVDLPAPNPLVLLPWEAVEFYAAAPGPLPFAFWTVGAAVLALAVLLSAAMYLFEDRLDDAPGDPVWVMGVLLAVSALSFTAASLVFQFGAPVEAVASTPFPGVLVPVGVVFQFLFAYVLLGVDRERGRRPVSDPDPE